MDEKNYNRAVKILAVQRRSGRLSMARKDLELAAGVDATGCNDILKRLIERDYVSFWGAQNEMITIDTKIIEYDKALNKRRDRRAEVISYLNSCGWWVYPALFFGLLLWLIGGLAPMFDVTPKDMLKALTGKVDQQQALPEPAKQNDVPVP